MRARGLPFSQLDALWFIALTGCAHAAPVVSHVSCPASPSPVAAAPVAPTAVPSAAPTPARELRWTLRVSDASPWLTVPATLYTFSLARWECALGEVQTDPATAGNQAALGRTRRLACTHSSGITVQTRLDCALQETTLPAARELELSLDTLPTLRVACEPAHAEPGAETKASPP